LANRHFARTSLKDHGRTLIVSPSGRRHAGHLDGAVVGVTLLTLVALMGCMFAPTSGIWLWALLPGIAQGGSFSLALTFIVLRSRNSHGTVQLSGMAQGVGYLIAACGPMPVGLLRGWTGSFVASACLFGAIGIALLACAMGAGRNRYVAAVTVPR
jgi:CP family cyanate transporter-like MFS transporter